MEIHDSSGGTGGRNVLVLLDLLVGLMFPFDDNSMDSGFNLP
jgi:hypothetical protein